MQGIGNPGECKRPPRETFVKRPSRQTFVKRTVELSSMVMESWPCTTNRLDGWNMIVCYEAVF